MQEQSKSERERESAKRLDFFCCVETGSGNEQWLRVLCDNTTRWEWKTHFTNAIIMLCLHCVLDAPRPRGSQCERWARVDIHTHQQQSFFPAHPHSDRIKRNVCAARYTECLCACVHIDRMLNDRMPQQSDDVTGTNEWRYRVAVRAFIQLFFFLRSFLKYCW